MTKLPRYLEELKELDAKVFENKVKPQDANYAWNRAIPRILSDFAAMKEALEFYADIYQLGEHRPRNQPPEGCYQSISIKDKAREVLKKIQREP